MTGDTASPADRPTPTAPAAADSPPVRPGSAGPALARAALAAARSAAKARDPQGASWRRVRPGPARWTGSGADAADPQRFGALVQRLVSDRGWERRTAEASVLGRWEHLVGPGIAAHSRPESLREGDLVVSAESTAWATQLRLLTPRILARISAELGAGVVRTMRVHGPSAPSWRHGPRTLPGRGPRDTYG